MPCSISMQDMFEFTLTFHSSLTLNPVLPILWAWMADFYPDNLAINLLLILQFHWGPLTLVKARCSEADNLPRGGNARAATKAPKRAKTKLTRPRKPRRRHKAPSKSKQRKAQIYAWMRTCIPATSTTRRRKLENTLIKGLRHSYAKSMKHTAYLKNEAGDLLAVSFEGDCHAATAWCPLCEEECKHSESACGASHSVELALSKMSSHFKLSHDLHGFEVDFELSKL